MSNNASKSAVLDRLRGVESFDKEVTDSFFQDLREATDEIRGERRAEFESSLVTNRARNRTSGKV